MRDMNKAASKAPQRAAASYIDSYRGEAIQIVCIALMLALATLAWRIAIA